jgi:hypothetical protein
LSAAEVGKLGTSTKALDGKNVEWLDKGSDAQCLAGPPEGQRQASSAARS